MGTAMKLCRSWRAAAIAAAVLATTECSDNNENDELLESDDGSVYFKVK